MNHIAVNIGIIGDYDPHRNSHIATNAAINHAAESLSLEACITWISTPSILMPKGPQKLEQYDGIWASPGSPYRSMMGAVRGIKFAREKNRPFIGT